MTRVEWENKVTNHMAKQKLQAQAKESYDCYWSRVWIFVVGTTENTKEKWQCKGLVNEIADGEKAFHVASKGANRL